MTVIFAEHFGTFSQLPDFLHTLKLSPAAKHTYAILAGFQTFMGEAYVCREKIKEKLGLALTTISSAVTELERNCLVKRTGKYKYGSYPIVQVFCGPEVGVSKRQHLNQQTLTEVLEIANLQLETNEIKKQQHEVVCSEKIVDPEKLKLIDALRGHGFGKNSAKALITRFGLERVLYQVEHLEDLLTRGDTIANPTAWLTKAVHKRYQKPKDLRQNIAQIKDDVKTEQRQTANRLLQQAEDEYRLENLDRAQALAQKSTEVFELPDAKKLLAEIAQRFERQRSREEVLKAIPQEVFERVLQQKREEQRTILMKLGINQLGAMGERAAYEEAMRTAMFGLRQH